MASRFHAFANPARFMRFADRILPWVTVGASLCFISGLYFAFFNSPPDYQQGETVRIMYVHVPAAWMAMFCYAVIAASSAAALVWKHPLAEIAAKAAAPLGAGFTVIALATGSLWGKPMWGTWWEFDARMTSVLILLFLYLGYMALHNAFDDPSRGARSASLLAVVGVVILPIIKYSVDWWNTLHQPASIMRLDGPTVHADMLWPLLLMAVAFKLYFVAVWLVRMKAEVAARKIRTHRLHAVQG
ncbi:MAG: heme ABC transporter permease [Pseudomonadota bacterium]